VDREILRLAIPALGALIAEPLFLLADSAMVGHLGVIPLAGLGIASAILQTIVGLMVFLAYGTTPSVARRLGAGDKSGAVAAGIDSIWLAFALGCVLAIAGWLAAPPLVNAFAASSEINRQAISYLTISMLGLPAMLLVFAATGLLRGLQNTRTPLAVAAIGFAANVLLNFVFIYVLGLGIVGSATGTVVAQWGMAAVYLVFAARHARAASTGLLPTRAGLRGLAVAGGWLLLRTASLRAAMLFAVFEATRLGGAELAAFQVIMTIFGTLAFAMDALAIAAQALVGRGLGASDLSGVRSVLRRCIHWGIGAGIVLGIVVIGASPVTGFVFTTDHAVTMLLPVSLAIIGIGAPLSGFVFVLDGVLIGAGDARYLALAGIVNLAIFAPLATLVGTLARPGTGGLAWLTAAFALGYLAARALTLGLRIRSDRWVKLGR
jgi:putative MATE family efflux protein